MESIYAWKTRRDAYLVILDGEQDEAVGVLLEKRLVCLVGLDARRSGRLLLLLGNRLFDSLGINGCGEGGDAVVGGLGIFLVHGTKVKLLHG